MIKDQNVGHGSDGAPTGRRRFLRAMAGVGTGTVLAGLSARQSARATAATAATLDAAGCGESVQDILNAALIAERLATTFYYTGLTTKAIARDPKVAGYAANPNAVSRNGNPVNVAYLQAALDQENRHAQLLSNAGATAPHKEFYFPASAFKRLGYTSHMGTFLWTVDHLETAFIGAYLAAIERLGALGRDDLALLVTRFLGVECEHRALYRVIAGDDPADNVTLEVASFACVSDVTRVLTPFRFSVTFGANERPAQLGRQQPWAVGGLYKVSQHAEDLFRPLFPKQKWPRNGDPGALQPYAPKVTENRLF